MKPFAIELQYLTPIDAFARVHMLPYSLFLDSSDNGHADSRYSYVVSHPCEMIEAYGRMVRITNRERQTSLEKDPFIALQERMDTWTLDLERDMDLPPFQGGAAGFFGYDLARTMEILPDQTRYDENVPDMAFGIYDQVLAFDHDLNKCWLITQATDEAQAKRKRRPLLALYTGPVPHRKANTDSLRWEADKTVQHYTSDIQKVIDYINKGDLFQANISQHFEAQVPMGFDAFEHYRTLRTVNPAPYAAFMNVGPLKISSASPERFLSVSDGHVETKPIKGTVPHVEDKTQDEKNKAQLMDSAKDRAENIMIVDLLRNDLSKVCLPVSVEVTQLCALETFSSVHHLVSTIVGELKESYTPLDAIKACFPGGSITGAPKVRAMEVIEELETTRRGPYCGSIAYIGFNGQMNSNILIRTLVYENQTIRLHVGGGITTKSDPKSEHQETLDKAEALFRSFDSTDFWRKQRA